MRPAGRQSSVIRFPSTCCAVYILSQHRADFSTGSACGPLRVCFALKRCEDSLTFFTQYFAPETGAHSEQVSRLFILILSALFVVLFAIRIAIEERALIAGLPGYADYTAQVRYRLVPGFW